MSTAAKAAIAVALKAARKVTGFPITYLRGSKQVRIERAGIGRRQLGVQSGDSVLYFRVDDFFIDPEDLVIDGVRVLPERGDKIQADIGNGPETFVVLPEPGIQPWEWRDAYEQEYRVHTKRVEEDPL